ncbi:MAG: hypothetical protein DRJ33_04925 [Candidatus Methanomethylicota archaeon]|uniref:Uncharacterized protein n=1 Tax=Thermoproteota archaeon TaxID=2056631 RepID=A0A497EWZ3_9CREN|nr:MAG: hypothetical protein DRJ33_04925 [Candidatus Verstraetearchaeota archaeon]
MLKAAEKLNIKGIALPGFEDYKQLNEKHKLLNEVKSMFRVELYTRANISASSVKEAVKLVNKLRRKIDLICIKAFNKTLIDYALRDKRVDLILLEPYPNFKITASLFSLARQNDIAIELHLAHLLRAEGLPRSKLIGFYKLITAYSTKEDAPLILSSGAKNWYELRNFPALSSMSKVLGLSKEAILDSTINYPKKIISRNTFLKSSKLPCGVEVL